MGKKPPKQTSSENGGPDLTPDDFHLTFPSELFKLFSDNSTDIFWVSEMAPLRILYVNPAVESIFGVSVKDVLADFKNVLNVIHPEDQQRIQEEVQDFVQGITPYDSVYRIVKEDGSIRWINDRGFVQEEKDGRYIGVGVARDVTEVKLQEEKLRESEHIFKIISDNTTDFITLIQDQKLVYYNNALEMAAKTFSSEDVYADFLAVVAPQDQKRIRSIHERRLKGEPAPDKYEMNLAKNDGGLISVEVRAETVDYKGRTAVLAVLRDITDRKKAEESSLLAKQVVESIPSGLFIYQYEEPDNLYLITSNPQAEMLTGISERQWAGKSFDEIWPGAKDAGITDLYLNVARTKKPTVFDKQEYSDHRLSGTFIVSVFPLPLNRIAVAFEDVTEREKTLRALENSEMRLNLFMESATDSITIWDQDLRLVEMSHSAEAALPPGTGKEDLIGNNLSDFASKEMFERSKQVLESGISNTGTDVLNLPGGKPKHLTIRVFKMGDGLGVIGTDISDQIEAEQAILRSERWFRGLLKGIPDAVFVNRLNSDGTIGPFLEVNDIACERLGYTREQLIGLSIYEVDDPDEGAALKPIMDRLANDGFAMFEQVHRTRDGRKIPVEIAASLIEMDDGNVLVSIARDITDRRKAGAELKRLAHALDQSAETIIITNTDGVIEYVNQAFTNRSGYTRNEVVGQTPKLLRSGVHDDSFYEDLWKTLARKDVWKGHLSSKAKNGSIYHEFCVISPVRDEIGETVNYISVQRDVTRERSLEQQLQHSQRLETVGNLTSGIAHDFNNLLTVISGNVDLLLFSSDDTHVRGELEEIGNVAERASQLTQQLLSFSSKRQSKPVILCLNDVLRSSAKLLRRTIGENIELKTDKARGLWSQKIDPVQLEQILVNLCVNARDAMPDGGTLTLRTKNVPFDSSQVDTDSILFIDHILLEVTDTGTGMDDDTKKRIFEPFYTTKSEGKGTGLGLSTVFGIVEKASGTIIVVSELGKGTTFQFRFPRIMPIASGSSPKESIDANLEGSETILLVEDDAFVRRSTMRSLARFGYNVIEQNSGENALEYLQSDKPQPDLILSDIIMPKMKGSELLERTRELEIDIPVILMSGYAKEAINANRMIEEGTPFVQKPFKPSELTKVIRSKLDEKKS
jgi:PAS domain S-box-containing protein